jgi:hypothetical protein
MRGKVAKKRISVIKSFAQEVRSPMKQIPCVVTELPIGHRSPQNDYSGAF